MVLTNGLEANRSKVLDVGDDTFVDLLVAPSVMKFKFNRYLWTYLVNASQALA